MAAQIIRRDDGLFEIEGVDDPKLRGPYASQGKAIIALSIIDKDRWAEIATHMDEAVASAGRLQALDERPTRTTETQP